MARPVAVCEKIANNPLGHISKNQRRRIASWTQPEEQDRVQHYQFLWAAAEDCLPCVEYWLEQGADVFRGQETHPEKTALWWARECSATRVLPLLEQAAAGNRVDKLHKIPRTQQTPASALKDGDAGEPEETLAGIWLDEDETTAALTAFFGDSEQRQKQVWRAAMQGDAQRVFELLHLESTSWPVKPVADDLPLRMQSWTLIDFVGFAIQFWTGRTELLKKLTLVHSVLREFEDNRVHRVVEWYMTYQFLFPSWLSWQQGLVKSEQDDCEENSMVAFWAAFASAELGSDYESLTATEDWCCTDPFLSAVDANIEHPPHCDTWPLRCFVAAFRPQHLSTVHALETQLISDALTGWWTFTADQRRAISVLLCESLQKCDDWHTGNAS